MHRTCRAVAVQDRIMKCQIGLCHTEDCRCSAVPWQNRATQGRTMQGRVMQRWPYYTYGMQGRAYRAVHCRDVQRRPIIRRQNRRIISEIRRGTAYKWYKINAGTIEHPERWIFRPAVSAVVCTGRGKTAEHRCPAPPPQTMDNKVLRGGMPRLFFLFIGTRRRWQRVNNDSVAPTGD